MKGLGVLGLIKLFPGNMNNLHSLNWTNWLTVSSMVDFLCHLISSYWKHTLQSSCKIMPESFTYACPGVSLINHTTSQYAKCSHERNISTTQVDILWISYGVSLKNGWIQDYWDLVLLVVLPPTTARHFSAHDHEYLWSFLNLFCSSPDSRLL